MTTTTAELHVLSLNLWDLPWPVSRARSRRLRAFAAAVGEWLRRGAVDVVALQELWRRRAPELPAPLHRPPRPSRSGLGVLTARRVLARGFHEFSVRAGLERLKRKGVLALRLELGAAGEALVAVLHVQAGARGAEVRRAQLREALAWIEEHAAGLPVVLAGDFNLDDHRATDAAAAADIEAAGYRDATAGHATFVDSNPYVRRRGAARLDRIYVRDGDGVRVEVVGSGTRFHDEPVSDHLGLWARLRFRR